MKETDEILITKAEQLVLSVLTYGNKSYTPDDIIKLCDYVRGLNDIDKGNLVTRPAIAIVADSDE